jgi:hypothetical protein
MRQQRSNGRRQASTLDPGYRPTLRTDFWALPDGVELTVCGRCSCLLPATDTARRRHRQFHEQVDAGDAR